MRSILDIEAVRDASRTAKAKGLVVGFVPTMGGLHAGHATLLRQARSKTGFVVASIFLNPKQFGPAEDLGKYPRTIDRDLGLCEKEGVDAVFLPDEAVMYPKGFQTSVTVEELSEPLCGKSRPGHFRGVATVVMKLFHIVEPDVVFFGQKDFQQLAVIKRMVADMNMSVRIEAVPTVRDSDGVALSSRNAYLSSEERSRARAIAEALDAAQKLVDSGETGSEAVVAAVKHILESRGVEVEYAELRCPETLEPVSAVERETLLAIAGRVGTTRLIDNRILMAS